MLAAVNSKEKELSDAFPKIAFGAPSIMDFTLGWPLSNATSFAKFAKYKELDPMEFSTQIKVPLKLKVHKALLRTENVERHCLVQCLTLIHSQDLYGEKIDDIEEVVRIRNKVSSLHMQAMAKPGIYLLKHHLQKWIIAKIRIRKAILTDRSKPAANELLLSNPFESKIFPDKAISEMLTDSPQMNILPALGLSLDKEAHDNPEPPPKRQKTLQNSGSTSYQTSQAFQLQKSKDGGNRPVNRGRGSRPGRGRGSFKENFPRGRGKNYKPREFSNTENRDKSFNKDKSQNQSK